MNTLKAGASIRIDASILETLKAEAKANNRSLSTYVESLLYRLGYRPDNEETLQACRDAQMGIGLEEIDTSSLASIERSLLSTSDAKDDNTP